MSEKLPAVTHSLIRAPRKCEGKRYDVSRLLAESMSLVSTCTVRPGATGAHTRLERKEQRARSSEAQRL